MFAARLIAAEKSDEGRLAAAFEWALARKPKAEETATLLKYLAVQTEYYRSHVEAAKKLLTVGNAPVPPGADEPTLAALDARVPGIVEPARDDHPLLMVFAGWVESSRPTVQGCLPPSVGLEDRPTLHDPRMAMPSPFDLICRRSFLGQSAVGLGSLALTSLLGRARRGRTPPHFPAKAKRVIHLCMAGGPSHLEMPRLQARIEEARRQAISRIVYQGTAACAVAGAELKARGPFAEFPSGASPGRRFPTCSRTSAAIADEMCIVRSLHTEQINHDPAHAFHEHRLHSRAGRAWARGCFTASGRKPTTCRGSSC